MNVIEKYWIEVYQKLDALWMHDGNLKRPHVILSSGNHSNGFFNSWLVIADGRLIRLASLALLDLFVLHDGDLFAVQGVVGPQTGATKLAELIGGQVASCTTKSCFWASPAKHEKDGKKSMIFDQTDLAKLQSKTVLLCDDVLTTGDSVDITANAVLAGGGSIVPFILVLVNRSGLTHVGGKKIIALIDRHMPIWAPEECLLCKAGSEPVGPPKDHWASLNATY